MVDGVICYQVILERWWKLQGAPCEAYIVPPSDQGRNDEEQESGVDDHG